MPLVARRYGMTRKTAMLESVPLGVTTWTFPLLAPAGTVVVISEGETTVKTAAVPVKLTLVALVRLVPRILTGCSHLAEGRPHFHKRAQTHGQAENGAVAGGTARKRCPVEVPIGVLDEPRVGASAVRAPALGAEAV